MSVEHPPGPLAARLIVLAETPDDASMVDELVAGIGPLAAELVEPALYASITVERDGAFTTVSASADLALAVDLAQYADEAGPCLDALESGRQTYVSDIASSMAWPGFRAEAVNLGLKASLSVPLFAGTGRCVANLNMYSDVTGAFALLAERLDALRDGTRSPRDPALTHGLDPGSAQLVAGLAEATTIRSLIQRAIDVVSSRDRQPADAAYLELRIRAAQIGKPLTEAALAVLRSDDAPSTDQQG